MHDDGHISSRRLAEVAAQEYFIPRLSKLADEIVANCVPCILASRKQSKQEGYLCPIQKIDIPLHTLHIDHLGPLPSTAKSYNYLFVVVDAFTKFVWLYPVKSTSADEVLRKFDLQSEVFGNRHRIVTDRGTAFTSTAFSEYCSSRRISHAVITTGVPRGNGQVERTNQTVISMLSKLSIEEPQKWYKHVPRVQRVINSWKSRSTSRTPFELMFGVVMRNKEDLELAKLLEEELVTEFDTVRAEMRREALAQIERIQEENRRVYNRKRKPARQYRVHDVVAIKRTQFGPGLKLFPKFLGPYEVNRIKGKDRYDVLKVGEHEGPNATSTSADFMKPWRQTEDSDNDNDDDNDDNGVGDDEADVGPPGSGGEQDGRMWELN